MRAGEEGYVRLGRGLNQPEGLCGINMGPSYPSISNFK